MRIQALFRMKKWQKIYRVMRKRAKKRYQNLLELVQTEKSYIENLKQTLLVMMAPLREKKVLDEQQITSLFSNIEIIYKLSEEFYSTLDKRM